MDEPWFRRRWGLGYKPITRQGRWLSWVVLFVQLLIGALSLHFRNDPATWWFFVITFGAVGLAYYGVAEWKLERDYSR